MNYRQTIRPVLAANELTRVDAIGIIAFTALVTLSFGGWGIVAGAGVLVAATLVAGPAAFVFAQLVLVSLLSEPSPWLLVATQLAVFPLLVSERSSWPRTRVHLISMALAYLGSLGVVWLLVTNLRWVWQAAALFVVAAATLSYGIHRYERVSLGLVHPEDDR
ncbi:hypothetical protein [Haloferax sp. DFSO52]|uniref:hypothetical protein n=1 Tax=Haloferax sp. DFSO52 TaxID=3388505 RepID=UPI003A897E2F